MYVFAKNLIFYMIPRFSDFYFKISATAKKDLPLYVYIVICVVALAVSCTIGIIVVIHCRRRERKPDTGIDKL